MKIYFQFLLNVFWVGNNKYEVESSIISRAQLHHVRCTCSFRARLSKALWNYRMTKRNECVRRDRSLSRRPNTVGRRAKKRACRLLHAKVWQWASREQVSHAAAATHPETHPGASRGPRAIVYQHRLSELLNREMLARTHAHTRPSRLSSRVLKSLPLTHLRL